MKSTLVVLALTLVWMSAAIGQNSAAGSATKTFSRVETARDAARNANAPLLSPRAFARAERYLEDARKAAEKQSAQEKIDKNIALSMTEFTQAIENAAVADRVLNAALKARTAARNAEANRLAARDWSNAEKSLSSALQVLEKGNLKSAQSKRDEATQLFDTAELNAIRTSVLGEARRLIAEADTKNVGRYAPTTLDAARTYANQADAMIMADRYTLEKPISLADQATYEARHAQRLAGIAERVKRDELTVENLLLDLESSFSEVATAANIDPDFSHDLDPTVGRIVALLEEIPGLRSDLSDRDALIIGLEDEIRDLDTQLGGASADRSDLIRRLEQQARVREQFLQVETMFTADEAEVQRDGNNLIVRLVGLSFAPNSSRLDGAATALLGKVRSAIDIFPQSELLIEGHTDSVGDAQRNLQLSEKRAASVQRYMIEEALLPDFRVRAVGFGDTRPIANNKTRDGRARNRRIDLIILPPPDSL